MRSPLALLVLCVSTLAAQQPTPNAPTGQGGGRPGGQGPGGASEGPKPYAQVITDKATTDSGVFVIHRLNDKLFYEIPKAALEQPFLLVIRYTATPAGTRYAGEELDDRVLRWQRVGNRVLLRDVSYSVVADSTEPVSRAVRMSNFEPVLMSFDVAAYGTGGDSSAVIDVTRLFTTDVPELSPKRQLRSGRGGVDPSRSLIERATAFPTNIEVEALQTFRTDTGSVDPSNATVSALMHYSMVRLPARPMMPRLCDNRVGYFSVRQEDY